MKLAAREAVAYVARPDPDAAGLLIYGQDAMRVALKREEILRALLGSEAAAEMRLARMPASDLRGDPARLIDETRASGFFPGPRAVLVEDAGDGLAEVLKTALDDWRAGDAQIVVTAGGLPKKSALRKLFESSKTAWCLAIYDNPPTQAEIEAELARAGVSRVDGDAMAALNALSRGLDPGDFRQTLDKLALYTLGQTQPVALADVAACAPVSTEADMDAALDIVAEARARELGPILRRLEAQGASPTGLCIAAQRHFRQLYTVASDPGGPGQGIGRLRPPPWGPRRDKILRQASGWGAPRLEEALSLLTDTDLALRSAGRTAPQMALVERALIRLAMMAGRA